MSSKNDDPTRIDIDPEVLQKYIAYETIVVPKNKQQVAPKKITEHSSKKKSSSKKSVPSPSKGIKNKNELVEDKKRKSLNHSRDYSFLKGYEKLAELGLKPNIPKNYQSRKLTPEIPKKVSGDKSYNQSEISTCRPDINNHTLHEKLPSSLYPPQNVNKKRFQTSEFPNKSSLNNPSPQKPLSNYKKNHQQSSRNPAKSSSISSSPMTNKNTKMSVKKKTLAPSLHENRQSREKNPIKNSKDKGRIAKIQTYDEEEEESEEESEDDESEEDDGDDSDDSSRDGESRVPNPYLQQNLEFERLLKYGGLQSLLNTRGRRNNKRNMRYEEEYSDESDMEATQADIDEENRRAHILAIKEDKEEERKTLERRRLRKKMLEEKEKKRQRVR